MLTQERLKEVLNYDPETGIFTRKNGGGGVCAGSVAGSKRRDGYIGISIENNHYYAHRLAFLYMDGYIPEYCIDHINDTKDDNKWRNLRHVNQVCNQQNRKVSKANKSGYNGVSWNRNNNKWLARINIKGRPIHLGYHGTALEAALTRIAAEDCIEDWHCDERCENRNKVFADLKKVVA
jgi:hypothetical protein